MVENPSSDAEGLDPRDPRGEYVPVQVEGLRTGMAREVELYFRTGVHDYFLIKPRGSEISSDLLRRYSGKAPYLYIHKSDFPKYYAQLTANLSKIIKDPSMPVRAKAALLTDAAVGLVDELFSDPGHPETIKQAKNFTQEVVNLIGQDRQAFLHLVELSSHDHYTYAHSVGVSAYAIALSKELGMSTPQELADVGMAGLLHDLGKCMVDPAIINKKGPLNPDEWSMMKKHPQYGGEILRRHRSLNPVIALAAEGHHEDIVGTGYPKGIVASQLDPVVRIVSLADAFSALTTKRSYSPARDSMSAFMLMRENLDKKFDAALFRRFVMLFLDPEKHGQAA